MSSAEQGVRQRDREVGPRRADGGVMALITLEHMSEGERTDLDAVVNDALSDEPLSDVSDVTGDGLGLQLSGADVPEVVGKIADEIAQVGVAEGGEGLVGDIALGAEGPEMSAAAEVAALRARREVVSNGRPDSRTMADRKSGQGCNRRSGSSVDWSRGPWGHWNCRLAASARTFAEPGICPIVTKEFDCVWTWAKTCNR